MSYSGVVQAQTKPWKPDLERRYIDHKSVFPVYLDASVDPSLADLPAMINFAISNHWEAMTTDETCSDEDLLRVIRGAIAGQPGISTPKWGLTTGEPMREKWLERALADDEIHRVKYWFGHLYVERDED